MLSANQSVFTILSEDALKGLILECLNHWGINNLALKPASEERPMSIDQAAKFTGISKSTLYHMASRKEVPCHRKGKRLIFLESELIQWIKEGKKGGNK